MIKTFDDFLKEVNTSMRPDEAIFRECMLDAIKHGMTIAAGIVSEPRLPIPEMIVNTTVKLVLMATEQEIKTARDNLKEI